MATALEKITAAGGTLNLGGRTLLLRRLTLGDYGQIKAWLRQRMPRPFQTAAQALADLAPLKALAPDEYEKCRKEIILAANEDVKNEEAGADPAAVERALNNPEGVAFVVWLAARTEQPNLTLEDVSAPLLSCDLADVRDKLSEITLFGSDEDEDVAAVVGTDPNAPGGLTP